MHLQFSVCVPSFFSFEDDGVFGVSALWFVGYFGICWYKNAYFADI